MILTIGILTYNRLNYLQQIVKTIQESKILFKEDIELVILNNGSTDGTSDYLNLISKQLKIRIIHKPENSLGTEPFLQLISEALGEWVILPGDDDVFNIDNLARLPDQLYGLEKEVALVSFGADSIDEYGKMNFYKYSPPRENSRAELLAKLICMNPFCMPSTIFRRSVSFRWAIPNAITAFDWSLWILSLSSGEIYKTSEPLVKYREHSGQIQQTYRQTLWDIDRLIKFHKLITESEFQKWLTAQSRSSLREFLEYLVTLNGKKSQSLANQLIFLWLGFEIIKSDVEVKEYVIEVLIRLGLDPRLLESIFSSPQSDLHYSLALKVLEENFGSEKLTSNSVSKTSFRDLYGEFLLIQRQKELDRQPTEVEFRILLLLRRLTKSKIVKKIRKLRLIRESEEKVRFKKGL